VSRRLLTLLLTGISSNLESLNPAVLRVGSARKATYCLYVASQVPSPMTVLREMIVVIEAKDEDRGAYEITHSEFSACAHALVELKD